MKKLNGPRKVRRFFLASIALAALVATPLLSSAHSRSSSSISIVNNSHKAVRNVYLSHVDADDWGDNQLANGTTIAPQQSQAISVSWDQQQVKVIAENDDGCFLSAVVSTTSNATWTITDDTPADCGGSAAQAAGN